MNRYRGRFAPSPSGPLHFGSLIAALGSWLDARHHDGDWLVRIEDIDPPREVKGAADDILRTLENYGLYWDQAVSYQSSNLEYYQETLERLMIEGLVYRCTCTRKQIRESSGIYQNLCRDKNIPPVSSHSLRLRVNQPTLSFTDIFQGQNDTESAAAGEDFILKRKDGLYAYMLAVVLDDLQQQMTHVIRGADLLETTTQQISLFRILKASPPLYGHLPLAVNSRGLKLSKQNHAEAISINRVSENLWRALDFMKQAPPAELQGAPAETILEWAIPNWNPNNFSGCRQFIMQDDKQ